LTSPTYNLRLAAPLRYQYENIEQTPNHQNPSDEGKGDSDKDKQPIFTPITRTLAKSRPSKAKSTQSTHKKKWTSDPAMFFVTLAGVIVVVAYTSVAAWQAWITQGQLSEAQLASRPNIYLKGIDRQMEELDHDTLIKWKYTWRNSGNAPALNLVIWNDCHSERVGKKIDFSRRIAITAAFIGPGGEHLFTGCEASGNYLKTIDAENVSNGRAGNPVRQWFFLYGGATYDYPAGTHHTFEYCDQIWWDNRKIDFGFELVPCDGVNAGHNCSDADCKAD
jgi:hypothetical protein